jgi:uncharacterized LabA/DUF88 family protein
MGAELRVAVLIDGGHLRAVARDANLNFDPDFIEAFAHGCVNAADSERLFRVLYYDCPGFRGKRPKPISGEIQAFEAKDDWLRDLAGRDMIAVRRGTLAWRGWQLKRTPPVQGSPLRDEDFKPNFEQKGVDMRIGLDIATISAVKNVDRIILVSADTDMIPAMKHARISGIQIVIVQLPIPPSLPLKEDLLMHSDFKRIVGWPAISTPRIQPSRINI